MSEPARPPDAAGDDDRQPLTGGAFDALGRVVSPRDAAHWRSRLASERGAELERLGREVYGDGYDDLRVGLVAQTVRPGRPAVTTRRPGRRGDS